MKSDFTVLDYFAIVDSTKQKVFHEKKGNQQHTF